MKMSETTKEIFSAFAKFQGEVNNPKTTQVNPQFRSKYSPLDVVINEVKPILAKYGLAVNQSTGSEGENIVIKTLLMHESGEWMESEPLVLPAYQLGKGGSKNYTAQGAGSAITYGRRYSLSAILGIASESDDDGNGAGQGSEGGQASNKPQGNGNSGGNGKASEKQMKMIHAKIAHVAVISKAEKLTIEDTLKSKIGTDSLTDISPQIASKAIETLIGWEDQYKKAN
ncbi:ERF family protein [Bacillus cereus group sp. N21]|uniref:ERF family protein n=1 Tax=Bacillus cereus group sp. N21 TaxID=2794591 RepID=UPI0018F58D68|nr:ERF family protein [Bacillus cereus group sp. N21]MBJ8031048.1 ERF family protein [Bacillus cereus group sp. N21]